MLKNTLISINKTLDNLITITNQDIEDIKIANHTALFDRNSEKEKALIQFTTLKSQIDSILVKRSESNKELSELINPEEDILLGEFKDKLSNFYDIHKKFAKMAFLISNFYTNLVHKVTGSEIDIGYKMSKSQQHYANFSLRA